MKSKNKTQGAITGVVAGEISLGSSTKSLLSAGMTLVADGAAVTLYETAVTGAVPGVDLTPGSAAPSSLTSVTLIGSEQPNSFGPRAIGVIVRSARDYGRVEISNAKICGYVEGVAVEGASLLWPI